MISIVLPTAKNWAGLTDWTLRSYDTQTNKDFEILIVEDGPPSKQVIDLTLRKWSFPVRYYNSPRTDDPSLAHKNHARNVGIKNARREVVFITDCDFMVQPNFIERIISVYCLAKSMGQRFCLYPPCAILKNSPHDINEMDWSHEFDPFLKNYVSHPDRDAGLRPIEAHPEGMHLMDRRLFEMLGLYDERFLGWGANKMELQRRINETNIKQALIEGCLLFHQPHPDLHSGDNHKRPEIKRKNIDLMEELGRARLDDPEWQKRKGLINMPPQTKIPEAWCLDWFTNRIPASTLSDDVYAQRIERVILKTSDPTAPILFCGPWVGEFGWEIQRWQGGIRKIAEKHDGYTIVVCGDPGHAALYPYAHEYWGLPRGLYEQCLTRESHRLLPEQAASEAMAAVQGVLAEELIFKGCNIVHVPANMNNTRTFAHQASVTQSFRNLISDQASDEFADFIRPGWNYVCLFPRRRDLNPEKNWPAKNWLDLIDWLDAEHDIKSVVLGRAEDTWSLDLSGRPHAISTLSLQHDRRLAVNIALLRRALGAIGSECGGPFLSMMCGCLTFVMGGTQWRKRYEVDENPLATPIEYVEAENYQHPYDATRDRIGEWLATLTPKNPLSSKEGSIVTVRRGDPLPMPASVQPDAIVPFTILERLERIEQEIGLA